MTVGGKKEGESEGWKEGGGKEREGTLLSIRKQLAWESHAEILKFDRILPLRQEW